MAAPKNYTVRALVGRSKEDRAEVAAILAAHPLWKEKHARELLAQRRFRERINNAGRPQ